MTDVPIRRIPLDGPPVTEMPDGWGMRQPITGGIVEYVSGCDCETHFRLTDHVLAVNLQESPCDIAVESDRYKRVVIPPGGLTFYPAETRAKIIAPNSGPYIAVTVAPGHLEDMLLEEYGMDGVDVRTVLGHADAAAHAVGSIIQNSFTERAALAGHGVQAAATLLTLHAVRAALIANPVPKPLAGVVDLRAACAYIDQSLAEPSLGIRAVAQAVDLPPTVLWQSFRAAFGMTPRQYIRQRRHAVADDLLVRGSHTPDEVTARTGVPVTLLRTVFQKLQ